MKWYGWVLLAIVVIVAIGFLTETLSIVKIKETSVPVEGSPCTITTTASRTAVNANLPIVTVPVQGTIVNGQCVKK